MKILRFKDDYAKEVSNIAIETFKEYNSRKVTQNALQNFLKWHTPSKIKDFSKTGIILIAIERGEILGFIRGDIKRGFITRTLVRKHYYRRGIGKKLLKHFESYAKRKNLKELKLNSSPYAVKFYESLNYIKTTGLRSKNGHKYFPMKKKLRG